MAIPRKPKDRACVEHVFTGQDGTCDVCGRALCVTQRRGRLVERLDGLHLLIMRDTGCPRERCEGSRVVHRPPEELAFALKKDTLGLDVVVEIGERRLRDHLSFAQIHALLRDRVPIAERTVADVFERFLALTRCRAGDTPEVRRRLRKQGGMTVLVDGVQFDEHSPVLYVLEDVISHTMLFAERREVRSAAGLEGLLERLKAMDVPILAFVTDKEKGLVPAIHKVFPDVPHQFCQLHFLKRCAAPLDGPLVALGKEVARAAEKLRAIRRAIVQAPPPKAEAEAAERDLAEDLLLAAHAASKCSGRAPFVPPALKRHEAMLRVGAAVERAAAKKGVPGRSSRGSSAR
jgi:hypothetical protein